MTTAADLQDALRASITHPDSVHVGPFVLTLDAGGQPGRNYAIPWAGAAPTPEDVRALRAAFTERGLLPRLEVVLPNPAVDALLTGGFVIEQRLPLLVLGSLAPVTPGAGVTVELAVSPGQLQAAAEVQDLSYGDVLDPDNPGRLARVVAGGGHVALVRVDGEPAGSGLITTPVQGLGQVAAVGTLAHFRRRGVAALAAWQLCARAGVDGTTPYLEVEGPAEQRLYERLGFDVVGETSVITG